MKMFDFYFDNSGMISVFRSYESFKINKNIYISKILPFPSSRGWIWLMRTFLSVQEISNRKTVNGRVGGDGRERREQAVRSNSPSLSSCASLKQQQKTEIFARARGKRRVTRRMFGRLLLANRYRGGEIFDGESERKKENWGGRKEENKG